MRRNAHRRFGTGLINAKDEVMALSVYGIGATRDRRHRDVAAGGGHDHDGSDIALLKRARHRRPPFFIFIVLGRFAHPDLIWPDVAEPGLQRATVTCVQTARCKMHRPATREARRRGHPANEVRALPRSVEVDGSKHHFK